jgi:hypothetical protein
MGDGHANHGAGLGIGLRRPDFDPGSDSEPGGGAAAVAEMDALIDALASATKAGQHGQPVLGPTPDAAWGESLQSYLREGSRAPARRPDVKKVEDAPAVAGTMPAETGAKPVVPAPPPGPVEPSVAAARALQMARNYLTAGHEGMARQKLQKIVTAYPDTPAAEEAAATLKQMAGAPGGAQAMAR